MKIEIITSWKLLLFFYFYFDYDFDSRQYIIIIRKIKNNRFYQFLRHAIKKLRAQFNLVKYTNDDFYPVIFAPVQNTWAKKINQEVKVTDE